MNKLGVIVLAAGKGTRMKSAQPKVLQNLAGKPLLGHILDTVDALCAQEKLVIVGFGKERVETVFSDRHIRFVEQREILGTGHAVQQCLPFINNDVTYLILVGDAPLVRADTLQALVACAQPTGISVLTVDVDDATGLGRIIRDDDNHVMRIVEHKDATSEELKINEINSGMFAVRGDVLQTLLPNITNDNAQKEYYLTDIVALANAAGNSVAAHKIDNVDEIAACNDRRQLAQLEDIYRRQQADVLFTQGVTLADPARIDVRGRLSVGQDVFIDINCVFSGEVSLGNNVTIEPNCVIHNATIGDNAHIKANTVIQDATLGEAVTVGPFARIRPKTTLAKGVKIGNFVELKNAQFAEGAKASHLSYVGDATVGEEANIGAGTITCNYDGANKHVTEIGKNAFIGSNSALVAPVTIGDNAVIGAGSTITKAVSDDALGIARGRQTEINNWQRPTKQQKKED